ncbi:mitochondrial ribosomal protein L39 isoform X2 [Rhodnius prolixus]|uniref:mitochondrial ribosomal protein L39 isoform X2 n=1 Tax=Rhodnius prolixus TaxID=13249 RepID=UPI003D18CF37
MNCLMRLGKNLKFFYNFRCYSVSSNEIERQNEYFDSEKSRQHNDIGRIEKIEVHYEGHLESRKFLMNKGLSTPYNVAKHISEWLTKESALALINEDSAWDMHRPLEDFCTLKFLRFSDEDPFFVNKAFWKFCSFLLGATVHNAFLDHVNVVLHSFPSPQITSGSFVYDVSLSLDSWKPSPSELRVLSADMVKLASQEIPLERLQVHEDIAKAIFRNNKFKLAQIPNIASGSGGQITLYRMGKHIDISKGPLIANSSLVGRCSVTAVHHIESDDGPLYRFQGVALPKGIMLNHFAYKILEDRASKLNRSAFSDQKVVEVA